MFAPISSVHLCARVRAGGQQGIMASLVSSMAKAAIAQSQARSGMERPPSSADGSGAPASHAPQQLTGTPGPQEDPTSRGLAGDSSSQEHQEQRLWAAVAEQSVKADLILNKLEALMSLVQGLDTRLQTLEARVT